MLSGYSSTAACAVFPLSFFLLTPVSPQCWNGTADECKEYEEFVPGYDLIGKGIDVTTMRSGQGMVLDMDQWNRSDGTCILCRNTVLKDNPAQRLPLAFANWTGYPVCHRELLRRVTYHAVSLVQTEELAVNNEWKTELNISLEPNETAPAAFGGSHSSLAEFSKMRNPQDKIAYYYLSSNCSYYKFYVSDNAPLTTHFEKALENLPETLDSTAEVEYRKLIETYGTHFAKTVYLGGLWKEATAIRLCRIQLDDLNLYTVSHCLKSEFSTLLGLYRTSQNTFQVCRKHIKFEYFHERFKDRYSEIKGGNPNSQMSFSAYLSTLYHKRWLNDSKEKPALVSYDIEPIYNLVATSNPRRSNLRSVIVSYVKERVMQKHCPLTCKEGSSVDLLSCSCRCVPNSIISSWCCANKRGLADLEVTIDYAHGLYGDYFSATDAFVIVRIQEMTQYTKIIWNNNSPMWFESFSFGYIDIMKHYTVLTVDIYDKDNGDWDGWKDDHLGNCEVNLGSGYNQRKVCHLKHGSLYYHYSVICAPSLRGSSCLSYSSPKDAPSHNLTTLLQDQDI